MGRAGSGPEFHINFGSGRVGSLHVGRVGSGQENWTHVQHWSHCPFWLISFIYYWYFCHVLL